MSTRHSFETFENPGRRLVPSGRGFLEFRKEEIEQSLPARFEQQVERHPDRLAVRARGLALTYAELNRLANRIARAIRDRRGDAEEPVALLLSQGATLVAAILGVLKAGKLYVPLDPSHPRTRIADTLEEAGAALLLTDAHNRALAAELEGRGGAVLEVDEIGASGTADNLDLPLGPETGAYIFYTSGSTGRPKGVVDIHRNVLHNVRRYSNTLRIGPEDRLSLIQSCSFSGTVSSLFGALANGAALFLFDLRSEGTVRLADWLVEERITIFHSVPVIFRSFVDGSRRFPDLRLVRLEGDRALGRDVELYRKYLEPRCVLVNGLGATETGLCRQYFIDKRTPLDGGLVPVGYPVEDMGVLLLDEEGRPVPASRTGEIAVQSRYLARGYWKRPDLDRAAFLPDPAGADERIFRTGDLGRLRPDGCLEHLGRKDFQLKIRGQRVEPAEVERALLEIAGVREAIVATREDGTGEARLVAYLVPSERPAPAAGPLRRALGAVLPDVLIPTAFVTLDALPVDSNGKVDRRALPAPAETAERAAPFVAPRDPLERRLATIFEQVLAVRPVGIRDDFFELGWDSLAAARVAARVETALGRPVSPALLLAGPTIERLATAMREEERRLDRADPVVALQPGGSMPLLFLIPARTGELLLCSELGRRLGRDQPVYVYRWAGGANRSGPLRRVEEMASDAVARLRRVQPEGPYRIGGFCFGAVIALEMARQIRRAGERVDLLALIGVSPYDLPGLVSPRALERYRRQKSAPTLGARLAHHQTRLSGRRLSEKLGYLVARRRSLAAFAGGKARRLLAALTAAGEDFAWRAACRWYGLAGRPLPDRLRDADRISRRAFTSYVPRTDPGRVVLFLAQKNRETYSEDPLSDFRGVSTGDLSVHEVPCHDGSMLIEPHVGILAEQIRGCLSDSEIGAVQDAPLANR